MARGFWHIDVAWAAKLALGRSLFAITIENELDVQVVALVALQLEAGGPGSRGSGGLENERHGGEELCCQHGC